MKASTQVVIKKVGPVGGTNGVVNDMNINGVNRIIKISVEHRPDVIDCLTVHFLHDNGEGSTEVWGAPLAEANLAEVPPFLISKLIKFQLCEREVESLISW